MLIVSLVQLVSYIFLIVLVLVSVAFLTLLERKILGYIQIRKGPVKVGYIGLFQPFSDAVKLFSKEQIFPYMSNFIVYYISPVFSLLVSLICWVVMPYRGGLFNFNFNCLFFLCALSVGVYPLLAAGWASNCKFSLLGSLRGIAQTVSYEVSLALTIMRCLFLVGGLDLSLFEVYQSKIWFTLIIVPLRIVWFASILAETNRTPFDFSEGESELVSGFNTEYRAGGFALIFMAEYSRILFIRRISVILLIGRIPWERRFYLKVALMSFLFVWVRGTLPRFRYDKLMGLSWKRFLPVRLNYLVFFISLKVGCEVCVIIFS